MEDRQKQKLFEMAPVLAFILIYFVVQMFDWMKVTQFIIAMFISLVSYFVMVTDLKEKVEETSAFKNLSFYIGMLTLIFILFFLHGFLHWNRMVSMTLRNGALFVLLFIYFFILFRAIRKLAQIKLTAKFKK